ncbi:MAG: hypothetical protein BRC27_00540, partial [Nanohaloarchaea archaeon SW_10_44_10]
GEVRIGVPDEKNENSSKLKGEVESKIDSASPNSQKSKSRETEVSLKDLERQNERIINLLEKLVDEDGSRKDNTTRGAENKDSSGMRGGMDELL